ncbi:helix-turn-helix domain-containing protein [Lentzea flava]|nr:helix-turn-helix transcriptional regulator [Lentzea flava]MCP2200905.1 Helix-turn-helix domain-containing protein [Lentzea flava]
MDRIPLTPQSRELGDELRHLRKKFAKGAEFAAQLGWDPSKVSNIERGKVRPTEKDLAQYLTACGRDLDCIDEFFDRYRNAFAPYYAQRAHNFSTIMFAEREATAIMGYSKATLPDLLRTEDYATHVLQQRGATPEQIRLALESLRERQRILRSPIRPDCVFYVSERTLTAHLGDDRATMDQLELLKQLSWALRIVPDDNDIPTSTGFVVYERDKFPTTVVVECDLADVFIHDDAAISRCRTVLATLSDVALSNAESRDLLSRSLADKYAAVIKAAAS